jgi:hypothetical protein
MKSQAVSLESRVAEYPIAEITLCRRIGLAALGLELVIGPRVTSNRFSRRTATAILKGL